MSTRAGLCLDKPRLATSPRRAPSVDPRLLAGWGGEGHLPKTLLLSWRVAFKIPVEASDEEREGRGFAVREHLGAGVGGSSGGPTLASTRCFLSVFHPRSRARLCLNVHPQQQGVGRNQSAGEQACSGHLGVSRALPTGRCTAPVLSIQPSTTTLTHAVFLEPDFFRVCFIKP